MRSRTSNAFLSRFARNNALQVFKQNRSTFSINILRLVSESVKCNYTITAKCENKKFNNCFLEYAACIIIITKTFQSQVHVLLLKFTLLTYKIITTVKRKLTKAAGLISYN